MVSMAIDHIGLILFPQVLWLRIVGRLAFPIYAYMIAEGCAHTRSMGRYWISMAALAAACQLVYFFAMDSLYMCILVTFSLSIAIIRIIQLSHARKQDLLSRILVVLGIFGAYLLCQVLPEYLPGTDYQVDYGFIGVMLPVVIYCAQGKAGKLVSCFLGLCCLAAASHSIQWWSLLAIIPLLFYSGQRGKWRMKWFFYLFYPAHLAVIHGISLL